ncbi:MAG: Hsp20 family protein [Luteitalea sp.]|nr:Hsp20 family protein [Luteitalea sp.]
MRWDPLHDLLKTSDRGARLVASHSAGWAPVADLYETSESYALVVELPGLRLEDLDLSATPNALTLRGERRAPTGEPASYVRVERGYGRFTRRFEFPAPIEVSRVSADLSDGVLTVIVPKTRPTGPGRVEVG